MKKRTYTPPVIKKGQGKRVMGRCCGSYGGDSTR